MTGSLNRVLRGALRRVYPPANMWFFGHRLIANPKTRDAIARRIAAFMPPVPPSDKDCQSELATLERDGWVQLPDLLNASQIADVVAWLRDKPCFDKWHPRLGAFRAETPPAQSHVGAYDTAVALACPHLLEAANDPMALAIASRFLGCAPTLSYFGVWWSFAGRDAPEQEQFFHRDVDDIKFVKLFINLTDVSEESGPHVFVKTSHRSPALGRIRRYNDDEVEAVFGRDQVLAMVGKAGTSFLENTFGFHKGLLPREGRRLVFSAEYSILPIPINKYGPFEVARPVARTPDPYINRLYVRSAS